MSLLYEVLWNDYSHNRKTFRDPAQNTVVSPNFLVWKFCRKAQFPHSFGRFYVKLRYFT